MARDYHFSAIAFFFYHCGPTEQVGEGAMPELETSFYSVSLLNDDETPMEFVVHVLEVFFDMDLERQSKKRF